MKSKVSEFFDESQARLLMENASFETLQEKAELFRSRGKDRADFKIVTIVLSGEVNVLRTLVHLTQLNRPLVFLLLMKQIHGTLLLANPDLLRRQAPRAEHPRAASGAAVFGRA